MASKKTIGYIKSKCTGSVYPYVDQNENEYGILEEGNSYIVWVNKSNYLQVFDNPEEVVKGVGKEVETVTNELGGKQSKVLYRFDLLDPKAMFEMTKVLSEGATKYGEDNWRLISVKEHINHLLIHAYAYLAGDQSDEHLSHIMCRALFAQAVALEG